MKTKRQFLVTLCLILAGVFGVAHAQELSYEFAAHENNPEVKEGWTLNNNASWVTGGPSSQQAGIQLTTANSPSTRRTAYIISPQMVMAAVDTLARGLYIDLSFCPDATYTGTPTLLVYPYNEVELGAEPSATISNTYFQQNQPYPIFMNYDGTYDISQVFGQRVIFAISSDQSLTGMEATPCVNIHRIYSQVLPSSVSVSLFASNDISCNLPQSTLTTYISRVNYPAFTPSYQWLKDNDVIEGADADSLRVAEVGSYRVKIFGDIGDGDGVKMLTYNDIEVMESTCYGCMDPYAVNYNPLATIDHYGGSCVYQTISRVVAGCTDSLALNYSPLATVDSGLCVFPEDIIDIPQPIYGCTDIKALNFNPNATDFDPSNPACACIYASNENSKLADIEGLEDTPIDTIGVKPIQNCQLQVNIPIVRAEIVDMEVLSPTQVKARWEIELEGGEIIITYFATYTVSQSGNTLFYLSIICKGNEARSLSLRAAETAGVTGFTVSALANVDLLGTTGIYQPETSQANSLAVYPNPTTGIVNISQNAEIKVYSPQGILLQELFGNQVDLSAYPAGTYLLQIDEQSVKVLKKLKKLLKIIAI